MVRPFYYVGKTESGERIEGYVFALDFSNAIDMIDTHREFCPELEIRPAIAEELKDMPAVRQRK